MIYRHHNLCQLLLSLKGSYLRFYFTAACMLSIQVLYGLAVVVLLLLLLLFLGFFLLLLLLAFLLFEEAAEQEVVLGGFHVLIELFAARLEILHSRADVLREGSVAEQPAEGALTVVDAIGDIGEVAGDDRGVIGGGLQAGHDGIGFDGFERSQRVAVLDDSGIGGAGRDGDDLVTHEAIGGDAGLGVLFDEPL